MGRIDDIPPPPPSKGGDEIHSQPRSTLPQRSPPAATQDYEDVPQQFPPPQHEIPHNFPPTQQFPPPQHEIPHNFPPTLHPQQQQVPVYPNQHQQVPAYTHQQQVPAYNNQYQQQSPYQGGVPMGHPAGGMPSPYVPPTTTVPNQQAWKTGLFDCMQDPGNAIITLCFPCVTFGQIAEIADSGATSCATSGMWYSLITFCIGMPCLISCTYRSKMRAVFGLVESPAPDWIVHCLCEYCALCQEYRELKERGYDPSIGWAGNQAIMQQKQQAAMAPPMQQRMV